MVNFCAVFGCENRADQQTLQLSEERRRMWLSKIGRSDIKISNFPYTRVCSDHFVSGKPADLYDKLNIDWAPTLNLGHVKVLPSPSAATDIYNRVLGRVKKRKRHDAAETLSSLQDVLVDDQTCLTEESVDHNTREIQTDLNGHNLEQIQQELRRLTIENMELKSEIASRKMTAESLEGDDDKVNYLTGLSTHLILMKVFSLISSYLT
ncbi:hypothetical protein ACJMK2_029923 [Sinanodonta woodiana]|uniref:THAP-type domain-containing protein n=1 Tax=Sinanodonta woodiana TaxID=1069815 RepID=A0ABD3XF43_SINWO